MSRLVRVLLYAGPFLVMAAGAAYLGLRWEDIPQRFPIHWGFGGDANGWANRTFFGVFGLSLIGFLCLLLMVVLAGFMRNIGRNAPGDDERQRAAVLRHTIEVTTLLAAWMISLLMTATSVWLPFRHSQTQPLQLVVATVVALVLVLIITVAVIMRAAKATARLPKRQEAPPELWKAGVFYYNPQDKRLWVEKRVGFGWTLNMANRASWWILIGLAALIIMNIAVALTIATLIDK